MLNSCQRRFGLWFLNGNLMALPAHRDHLNIVVVRFESTQAGIQT
jgi:hypothetical protein